MLKVEETTFWGVWDCTSCDKKDISGELVTCPACGNPRDVEELAGVREGTERKAITDKDELAVAKGGADWSCLRCGSGNRITDPKCKKCGSPWTDNVRWEAAERPHEPDNRPILPDVHSGAFEKCLDEAEKGQRSNEQFAKRVQDLATIWVVLLGMLLLSIGGYAIWWGFQTYDVNGSVTEMNWAHTVWQDRFNPVTKEGWHDDLHVHNPVFPVNGLGEVAGVDNVRNCHPKFHHTRHYTCGTERVCSMKIRQVADGQTCRPTRNCRTSSNGNGSYTQRCTSSTSCSTKYRSESYRDCQDETKWCDEPIYEKWCDYDTWEWQTIDTKHDMGSGPETRWPPVELGLWDRRRTAGDYAVRIAYKSSGKPYIYEEKPTTEDIYKTWSVKEPVTVVIYNLGVVAEIKRPTQPIRHPL